MAGGIDIAHRVQAANAHAIGAVTGLSAFVHSRSRHGRIVCIGDSTTQGQNPPPDPYAAIPIVSYPTILGWMLGRSVVNKGVSGNKLADVEARLQADVIDREPAMAVFLIGSNNLRDGEVLSATSATVRSIATKVADAGIPQAWCAVLPRPSYPAIAQEIHKYNRFLERFCYEEGYIFIDTYSPMVDSAGAVLAGMLYDNTHETTLGTKTVATVVAARLSFLKSDIPGIFPGETQGLTYPQFEADTNADGLANGWTSFQQSPITGTVFSRVAHPTRGYWQQVAKGTSTHDLAKAAGVYQEVPNGSNINWQIGYYCDVMADVETDAIGSDAWGVRIIALDAGFTPITSAFCGGDKFAAATSRITVRGSLMIPANTAHVQVYGSVYGGGPSTVRFGNIIARKRTVA